MGAPPRDMSLTARHSRRYTIHATTGMPAATASSGRLAARAAMAIPDARRCHVLGRRGPQRSAHVASAKVEEATWLRYVPDMNMTQGAAAHSTAAASAVLGPYSPRAA